MTSTTASTSFPTNFPQDIKSFIQKFYRDSDNPTDHDTYAQDFTPDAHAIFGPREAQGRDAILAHQRASFASKAVVKRTHFVEEVFTFGECDTECMLRGRVVMELAGGDTEGGKERGTEAALVWAARASYVREDEGVRLRFYQVYLVGVPFLSSVYYILFFPRMHSFICVVES